MIFYKKYGLYLQQPPQWAIDEFGHNSGEKGDIIYNTMRKIIDDNDKSDWAYSALCKCGELLFDRKRWPDEMNSCFDATRPIQYLISKYKHKLGLSSTRLYRLQRCMTRDPYIYFYACCVKMDRIQYIEAITIPVFNCYGIMWRPKISAWRRALITGRPSWIYEMLESNNEKMLHYVSLLKKYRKQAYRQRTNQTK